MSESSENGIELKQQEVGVRPEILVILRATDHLRWAAFQTLLEAAVGYRRATRFNHDADPDDPAIVAARLHAMLEAAKRI